MERSNQDRRIDSNYAKMRRIVFFIMVACCFFEHLMAQTMPEGTWTVKTDSAEYVFSISGNNEYSIKANPKDMSLYYELKGTVEMGKITNTEDFCVAFKECKSFSSKFSGSKLKEEIVKQTINHLIKNLPRFGVPIDDFDSQLKEMAKYFDIVSEKIQHEVHEINGHIAVDLGLSVKWATCNVGASSCTEYGYSLEWGIPTPDMQWSDRYQGDSRILPLKWDAANQNWGGNWRMPSDDELEELITKCTWKFYDTGKVGGFIIIGPNGNRIFLPMAGNDNRGGGWYWSSARSGSDEACCLRCWFDTMEKRGGQLMWTDYRSHRFNIRPVIK